MNNFDSQKLGFPRNFYLLFYPFNNFLLQTHPQDIFIFKPINIANVVEVLGFHLEDDLVHSFLLLAHLNSAIDPILYAYNLPDFQQSLRKLRRRSSNLENWNCKLFYANKFYFKKLNLFLTCCFHLTNKSWTIARVIRKDFSAIDNDNFSCVIHLVISHI